VGPVCRREERKRKREPGRGLPRGGAGGPPGQKGGEGKFLFFSFLFFKLFQINFKTQIQINLF
jgi:hypothetical protein